MNRILNISIFTVLIFLLIAAHCSQAQELQIPDTDRYLPGIQLESIAFGSCLHQERGAPILSAIIADAPDVFLFLGDNIYKNTGSAKELEEAYRLQKRKPLLKELFKTAEVHAVWDDNDYGARDGGKEYSLKKESKSLFLSFFEVPESDPRRYRDGIYHSAIYGKDKTRVQILFLDTRWFRDSLTRGKHQGPDHGPYVPNDSPGKTMLGEQQWQWLTKQLTVPASLRIIVSSIQVIPFRHGYESWGTMPQEQKKLFTLLSADAVPVVLLSGDRHHGEISSLSVNGKTFVEVTSSSLNLPRSIGSEENEYRIVGEYRHTNYGVVDIDWLKKKLFLSIRSEVGTTVLEHQLSF